MKLFSASGSCSLGTQIVLEWIGKPYEVKKVTIHPKSPELLDVNPAGAVPVLDDDGFIITQNVAIYNYLIDSFPEAGLGGDGTARGRALVNRWLGFINSELHTAFKPFFGATAYLEDETAIQKTKDNAAKVVRAKLVMLDEALAGQDGLVGSRSVADAYLYVTLRWSKMMQIAYDDLGNLQQLIKRLESDEGVKKVLAAHDQKPLG